MGKVSICFKMGIGIKGSLNVERKMGLGLNFIQVEVDIKGYGIVIL